MFFILGSLRGGRSINNAVDCPGITLFKIVPDSIKTINIEMKYNKNSFNPNGAISPAITPNCAEQGMVNPSNAVAMNRSLLEPRILVVMVAMVTHPKPNMIGMIAFPFNPILVKDRSVKVATLGK